MAMVEGVNVSGDPGVVRYRLAGINPTANPTSCAWIKVGAYGFEGCLEVEGYATTTVAPQLYGWAKDTEPTSTGAGTTGTAYGPTYTANGFYDVNNAPTWLRIVLPANTTTANTLEVFYVGRSGFGIR